MKHTMADLKKYRDMTKGELIHEIMLRDRQIREIERKRTKNAAELRRLATVVFDSNDAITVQNLDGTITAWNKGAEQMYGYSEVEALGMNISEIVPDELKDEALDLIRQLKTGRPVDSLETRRVTKEGRILDVWLTLTMLTDDKGNIVSVATTERDITERKEMERELRLASITDEMTGLYNRRGFRLFAEKVLMQSERNNSGGLLLYCDLDNLKMINDRFGHREGDHAIMDFAGLLKETFRKSDIIARLGGDEFAVLVAGVKNPGIEQILIQHLKDKIGLHNDRSWRSYLLDVSIGVSSFNAAHTGSLEDLLIEADRSMYREKKNKKGKMSFPVS